MLTALLNSKKKKIAVLIDPDKVVDKELPMLLADCDNNGVDFIFVGGSLLYTTKLVATVELIKANTSIPVILFPGDSNHVVKEADGILLLSLISGRNADYLVGQHVVAAPTLKASGLEILPTGYILVDCGATTAASYMSNTLPIPYLKDEIAVCTAMAGEMLGLKFIFMDGGSGADKPIATSMIERVKKEIEIPLIIGGGIQTQQQAFDALNAGADVIVVGNAIEKDKKVLLAICEAKNKFN